MESGVYLLLGGVAVFVLAVKQGARYQRQLPMPQPRPDAPEQATRSAARARWSVAAGGAAIGGLLFILSLGLSAALPKRTAEVERLLGAGEATGAGESHPTDQAKAERCRLAPGTQAELAPFPGSGRQRRLHADQCARDVGREDRRGHCLEGAGAGQRLQLADRLGRPGLLLRRRRAASARSSAWTARPARFSGGSPWRMCPAARRRPAEVPESTGYAASTMATDGRRVYVIFANGDCAAFTLEGKPAWSKSFGALKNPYGHATSLATWQDRLIVQLDQGDSEDNKSKLYALDGRTGQIVWQRPRKVGASWATPIVIEAAGKAQVITLAVPCVIAYAATDGAELWRVEGLNGEITPSPVFAGGLLFVASPSEKLLAIRPDGQGDVTKTHVVWTS